MQDDDLSRIRQHAEDCDRRLLVLETKSEFQDGEVSSLRASRHEHGNWLNRHNLEIDAMQQTLKEFPEMKTAVNTLVSDAKVNAWKIGAIIAALLFVANQIASRIHF
jgi:uncharacterized coiled-coil protein SlyX